MPFVRTDPRSGVWVDFYSTRVEADAAGAALSSTMGEIIVNMPVLGRDPNLDYVDNQLGYWLYAVVRHV